MTTPDGAGADAPVAVVDCGSNTTRLLLAHVVDGRVACATRRTVVTRLAAGVDRTGRLSEAALLRVTSVLERYAAEWRTADVTGVAVCATSAVRDAVNATSFADEVEAVTGVLPVVLPGADEAELTYAGAVAGRTGRHVVCDVGGGSTELVAGVDTPEHRVSLPLGSVRLRERHLHTDPPTPHEYAALIADADAVLASQSDVYSGDAATTPVAVAGTATTLAGVATGTGPDDAAAIDGVHIDVAELTQLIENLAWVPAQDRLHHAAIVPGREDVVVAGALVLARVAHRFGWRGVEVRIADLLDGIALQLVAGTWPPAGGVVPA